MEILKQLEKMINKNNGLITTAQVSHAGIPREYLSRLVQAKRLYKLDRGIYLSPEAWEDEMLVLQSKYQKGIFSHETALFLHGFSDRTPNTFFMTFPRGYHSAALKNEKLKVKTSIKKVYHLGIEKSKTIFGNFVSTYDLEKTLCDVVKGNNTCDIQIVSQAMKKYSEYKGRNLSKLLEYAEIMRVKKKILNYMEILL
jgi:predicted transcriptional regulator of viral defense system